MGTKTISISDDAYARLKAEKREKESFTDAIIRLTGKRSLMGIAGFLEEGEAKGMEETLKKMRSRSRARTLKIAEEMRG